MNVSPGFSVLLKRPLDFAVLQQMFEILIALQCSVGLGESPPARRAVLHTPRYGTPAKSNAKKVLRAQRDKGTIREHQQVPRWLPGAGRQLSFAACCVSSSHHEQPPVPSGSPAALGGSAWGYLRGAEYIHAGGAAEIPANVPLSVCAVWCNVSEKAAREWLSDVRCGRHTLICEVRLHSIHMLKSLSAMDNA